MLQYCQQGDFKIVVASIRTARCQSAAQLVKGEGCMHGSYWRSDSGSTTENVDVLLTVAGHYAHDISLSDTHIK